MFCFSLAHAFCLQREIEYFCHPFLAGISIIIANVYDRESKEIH
jgi:hypothetical protein